MKVALDTNVLVYAEGVNGAGRRGEALALMRDLPVDAVVLPVQALGELFAVLVRKAGYPASRARSAVLAWRDAYPLVETSPSVLIDATDLSTAHQLSIWDAVILSAAAKSGCRLLLSEDLQDGFTWNGVTAANPFAKQRHQLLEALLAPSSRQPGKTS